jgi:putative component of toxin-antitoxin plasmid stabilization module
MYQGEAFVILLAGGDKGAQSKDIEVAKELAKALKEKS